MTSSYPTIGDDAQSIYSFRAATVRNILDFPGQFEPSARIVTLEQNYRSTQPILDACNSVIEFAAERFTKNLQSDRKSKQRPFLTTVADETAQARYVAQQILDAREAGTPLKSQAVLFRASHHSAQLEIELSRRNIPFVKYGGLKFLEAAHVKDVISVFRWGEIRPTELRGLGCCSCCQVLGRPRPQGFRIRSSSNPASQMSYRRSKCRKQRPKTGLASPSSFVEYARPRWLGLRNFSSFERGTSRICFDCMTMVTCGRLILANSSRSQLDTSRESDSLPSLHSIHRTQRAAAHEQIRWTKIIQSYRRSIRPKARNGGSSAS
jgi:UvrD-like helicase C-terminal domain/UvrD/REP helicase N-terminal domain